MPDPKALTQALAARTLELVSIPSIYGDETALCDHMEQWAAGPFEAGEIHRDGNALFLGAPETGRPNIALVGHLDTVVPSEGSFPEPCIDGNRLFGLGSSDMKGGVAVACALADDMRGPELAHNLILAFYDKEEGPDEHNGLRRILDRFDGVDLAFVMEPTNNVMQVGCIGSMHATVTWSGKAAHSARPWHGENAIHKAGDLLARLHAMERNVVVFDGHEFYEVVNATLATGGIGRTTIPPSFELNINYRFAPGRSLDEAESKLRELVGPEAHVEITDRAPSGRVCLDNPLVQEFLDVSEVPVEPKQAWTDVARLSEAGVDAVNYGPGETAQAHQAGESAPIDALGVAYRRLAAFLKHA